MPYTNGDVLVRAVMKTTSGLVEDRVINDFAFRKVGGTTPTEAELDDVFSAVSGFYRTDTTAGSNVGNFISSFVDRAQTHELQAYKIQAPPIGSPIYTDAWLGPASVEGDRNQVNEVAGTVSFHGDLTGVLEESGSTRPRARRRGRLYIGPLRDHAVDNTSAPRLSALFTTTLRQAIIAMADAAAADGWIFSVWSRANSELYAVVGGWTDDAPDTQRRRGVAPSARIVYTV